MSHIKYLRQPQSGIHEDVSYNCKVIEPKIVANPEWYAPLRSPKHCGCYLPCYVLGEEHNTTPYLKSMAKDIN